MMPKTYLFTHTDTSINWHLIFNGIFSSVYVKRMADKCAICRERKQFICVTVASLEVAYVHFRVYTLSAMFPPEDGCIVAQHRLSIVLYRKNDISVVIENVNICASQFHTNVVQHTKLYIQC